jgi:tetratricopeptide (TPR) repeat protein
VAAIVMRIGMDEVQVMCHYNRGMRNALTFSLLATVLAVSAAAQVSEGDQHWNARAEGHQGGHAKATQIDAAIIAFQKAVMQEPNNLEARWKLLRAIRFKGAYVASTDDEKKRIYAFGKSEGQASIDVVNKALVAKGVKANAPEKKIADAARSIPGAGEVFFWDSVNWGEWALAYGKISAVREGAADRIRREATIAMLVDSKIESGGPQRVLGRLHDQTPHIPFFTGWASSDEAVRFLKESIRIDPTNKITRVFLADAMVSDDGKSKSEALRILREVINSPNDPNFEVEEARAQEDARALLKDWGE